MSRYRNKKGVSVLDLGVLAEDFLGVKAVPGIRRREGDDIRHVLNLGPWPRTSVESAGSPVLLGAPSPGPSALAGALAGSGGKRAVFVGVAWGAVLYFSTRPDLPRAASCLGPLLCPWQGGGLRLLVVVRPALRRRCPGSRPQCPPGPCRSAHQRALCQSQEKLLHLAFVSWTASS